MSGTSEAVTQATRLPEIGFPEFTTKLITDVFDALVSANLRQTESYINLLQQVGKSLTQFINDTKDDIDGEQTLQFLAAVLPPAEDSDDASKVKEEATLLKEEAKKLNGALEVAGAGIDNDNKVFTEAEAEAGDVKIDKAKFDLILEAVAKRIAADKYTLLKEMVQLGILRLVVEEGLIETRLLFKTYGTSLDQDKAKSYQRKAFAVKAKAGFSLLKPIFSASAATKYSNIRVSTSEKTDQDRSGSQVQIFGLVRIKFKTDYQPLNQ